VVQSAVAERVREQERRQEEHLRAQALDAWRELLRATWMRIKLQRRYGFSGASPEAAGVCGSQAARHAFDEQNQDGAAAVVGEAAPAGLGSTCGAPQGAPVDAATGGAAGVPCAADMGPAAAGACLAEVDGVEEF
jgi:hypothetical protein